MSRGLATIVAVGCLRTRSVCPANGLVLSGKNLIDCLGFVSESPLPTQGVNCV